MSFKAWTRVACHPSSGILLAGCAGFSPATTSAGSLATTSLASANMFAPGPTGMTNFNIYGNGTGTAATSYAAGVSGAPTGLGYVTGLFPTP